MEDSYYTIASNHKEQYSIQRSKFTAFAFPIKSVDEALEHIQNLKKEFFDATHVCWAYALGQDRGENRANDDGEPSGTAGRPIYGQILSHNLSDVLVAVVRYFGGVKLGTGGLIEAYKEGAKIVLQEAPKKEIVLEEKLEIQLDPNLTGKLMYILKQVDAQILNQDFKDGKSILFCSLRLAHKERLEKECESLFGIDIISNTE